MFGLAMSYTIYVSTYNVGVKGKVIYMHTYGNTDKQKLINI